MSKISVQLLFSEEEYGQLQSEAEKRGLTVPLYIKGAVLTDDAFGESYRTLLDKVEALPNGTRFDIRSVFGVEWTMSRGVKLNLGKTFYNRVVEGVIANVDPIGKDSNNVMWYEKKEANENV